MNWLTVDTPGVVDERRLIDHRVRMLARPGVVDRDSWRG